MAIDYVRRTEMASTSKEVSELYFAALELLEVNGFAMSMDLLSGKEADAINRLSKAVEDFQGEELTSSNENVNKESLIDTL